MVIDWFTIVAQAINFLVLVWLMKRFLYKPILAAIDAREVLVKTELEHAASQMAEATKERDEFNQKNADFAKERDANLAKAAVEATAEHARLIGEATKASADIRTHEMSDLKAECDRINKDIVRRTSIEAFAVARKALSQLANVALEAQMTDVFIAKIRSMPENQRNELKAAVVSSPDSAVVQTSFKLPDAQRASISGALQDVIGLRSGPQFSTNPDIVTGIEFTASGRRVAWTIDEALRKMEEAVSTMIEPQAVASIPPA